MRTTRWAPVLAGLFLVGGCGGNDGPRVPTGAGGGTRFLTVSVTSDTVKCGKCETVTATLTTAGGATQTVAAAWRTDMPSVATIDSAGALTAVAHGDVTIIATYEDLQASKLVHVVNDYEGQWLGQYVVSGCTETGAFTGWCDMLHPGAVMPLGLDVVQERTAVSGTLWLGSIEHAVTGAVGTNGEMSGEAKGGYADSDGRVDTLVSPLRFARQGARIGDGSFSLTVTANGYVGSVRVEARVMGLDPARGVATSRGAPHPRSALEALRTPPGR